MHWMYLKIRIYRINVISDKIAQNEKKPFRNYLSHMKVHKTILLFFFLIALFSLISLPFAYGRVENGQRVAQIIMSDNGFNPEAMQLEQGAILVFKNDGKKTHW